MKKITLFFVPEGTNKVRQIKIPRFLVPFCTLAFVAFLASLYWFIQDYQYMKAQMPRLVQLEKKNEQREKQFTHLNHRIKQVTQKMSELKEFDRKLKVMVNIEPDKNDNQVKGVGGPDPKFSAKDYTAEDEKGAIRLMHRSLDFLDSEISIGEQDKAELHEFLESQKMLLASTPSIWPTKGWLSSGFGRRISPFTGKREFHKGVDVAARIGAPIVSSAEGIVSYVGWDHGYGKEVCIKHGYGLKTRYGHVKKALVKKGQHVKRGEIIALVGNTGRSTGPHLHYEVHLNGVPVNPLHYILN